MKTNIGGGIFHLAKYILFFFIILVQSCASVSVTRLESIDFKENLPGLWEGRWSYGAGREGIKRIKIIKIDGNKVHLTGYLGGGQGPDADTDIDEVYGRIENSTLLFTFPDPEVSSGTCREELRMIRDDSNNLILGGPLQCGGWKATVRLKKIE